MMNGIVDSNANCINISCEYFDIIVWPPGGSGSLIRCEEAGRIMQLNVEMSCRYTSLVSWQVAN